MKVYLSQKTVIYNNQDPTHGVARTPSQPLLTNALPVIPEEPSLSIPLIIQGNFEAHQLPTAVVGKERGIS